MRRASLMDGYKYNFESLWDEPRRIDLLFRLQIARFRTTDPDEMAQYKNYEKEDRQC